MYSRVRADTSGRVRVVLTLSHVGQGGGKGRGIPGTAAKREKVQKEPKWLDYTRKGSSGKDA